MCILARPASEKFRVQVALHVAQAVAATAQQTAALRAQQAGSQVHHVPAGLAAQLKQLLAAADGREAVAAAAAADVDVKDSEDLSQQPERLMQALTHASAQIGKHDLPLVMAQGKPEPFVPDIAVLPYKADTVTGTWIKVRHRTW